MNISGNFQTADREVAIVKRILDEKAISYLKVEKYGNADDGDVVVVLPDGREIVIEVKEEEYNRFVKYGGDLGIDYISAFHFKYGVNSFYWKKQHGPEDLEEFKRVIDTTRYYKEGKVFYSKSDLWLFFVVDPNDEFYYCKFFTGDGMTSREFINYIETHCIFTANRKPQSQMSHNDRHSSACFFLNHRDRILENYEVDIAEYLGN